MNEAETTKEIIENLNFTDCTDMRYQILLNRLKLERRLNNDLRGRLKKLSVKNEELETELQQYRTLVRDIDNAFRPKKR